MAINILNLMTLRNDSAIKGIITLSANEQRACFFCTAFTLLLSFESQENFLYLEGRNQMIPSPYNNVFFSFPLLLALH